MNVKRISAKIVVAMLDEFNGVYATDLHELSRRADAESFAPYRLNDGRIIAVIFNQGRPPLARGPQPFQGRLVELGWLYETGDAFVAEMRRWERRHRNSTRNRGHVLACMLPDSQDFLTDLPSHLEKLTTDLKIPESRLDGSIESLRYLNRPIRQLDRDEVWDATPVHAPVFAYVGEVLRIATNGRWHLHRFKPKPVWRQANITYNSEAAVRAGLPATLEALIQGGVKSSVIDNLQAAGIIELTGVEVDSDADATEIWEPRIIADNGHELNFAVDLATWLTEHSKTPELPGWVRTSLYRAGYKVPSDSAPTDGGSTRQR